MAMMAKMRSLAPAFMITIGGIFILYMVLSDSRVIEIFGQSKTAVGSVNGEDISYQQFNTFLDQAKQRQKEQTGKDIDEENMDAFNDQVWDAMVTQQLIKEQYKKFGIAVTDQEVQDVLLGPNPPEALRRQFTDSTGKFNRPLYEATLRQQKKEVLLGLEESIKEMRMQEKLQNYLFAAINVSEGEIQRRYDDQNIKMKDEYVLVDVNGIADNEVSVNDADITKYYNENADKYKVEAQRKLKYVVFSKAASKEDSTAIMSNLSAIVAKAKDDTASFRSYIQIYSEMPYSKDTVKQNQLSEQAISLLASAQPGAVVGPVATYEGYVVYKLLAKVPSKEEFVRASHILIPFAGDEAKAQATAMDIYNKLQAGADFAQMAKEKSTDYSSAQKGGDLGYFGKGQMVKEFEDAAFNGQVGVVQKPIKTQFGYHIIKPTGKSNSAFVVEKLVNKIKASGTTTDNAFNSANDFEFLIKKSSFEQEAKLLNHKILETPAFTQEGGYLPGIGVNKNLVDWAFDKSMNDVSEVYKGANGYIVAMVSEVIKPGVKSLDEVKAQIKPLVLREKKFEKAGEIAGQISKQAASSSLSAAAANFATKARFDTTGTFTAMQSIPNVGRDWAFINKSQSAPVGKITEPVKGQRGYYVIKVLFRTSVDKGTYTMQRNSLRDGLLQEKKSYFFNQWLAQLKKDAKIKDNRRTFYR